MKKRNLLYKPIQPFWVWVILSTVIAVVYKFFGFEYAVLISFMTILWHKIVIESEERKEGVK